MPDTSSTKVLVQSCCDSTEVTLDLTADETALLRRVASAIHRAAPDAPHSPTLEVVA